jgi:phosphatidate cytidylyltransferase
MSDSTGMLYNCIGGIFSALLLATLIVFGCKIIRPKHNWLELQQRIRSWWVIICLFSCAMLSPKWLALIFFICISFLSLKEFLALAHTRRSDSVPVRWMYAAIPLQFLWIGMSWYGMFITFIPIYVFLFLPARMVIIGDIKGFLRSASVMHWGMMTTVFALSHVAFLLTLPAPHASASAVLVIFLVTATELNDIAQYLWGKSLGKIKVAPEVSPNKTLAGLLGGVFTTTLLATLFGPVLTTMDWSHSLMAGVIISVSGFFGDIVMSAIKRDFGVKDTGKILPGHGGILDRLDSLIYTAPLFFHFYHYFYV